MEDQWFDKYSDARKITELLLQSGDNELTVKEIYSFHWFHENQPHEAVEENIGVLQDFWRADIFFSERSLSLAGTDTVASTRLLNLASKCHKLLLSIPTRHTFCRQQNLTKEKLLKGSTVSTTSGGSNSKRMERNKLVFPIMKPFESSFFYDMKNDLTSSLDQMIKNRIKFTRRARNGVLIVEDDEVPLMDQVQNAQRHIQKVLHCTESLLEILYETEGEITGEYALQERFQKMLEIVTRLLDWLLLGKSTINYERYTPEHVISEREENVEDYTSISKPDHILISPLLYHDEGEQYIFKNIAGTSEETRLIVEAKEHIDIVSVDEKLHMFDLGTPHDVENIKRKTGVLREISVYLRDDGVGLALLYDGCNFIVLKLLLNLLKELHTTEDGQLKADQQAYDPSTSEFKDALRKVGFEENCFDEYIKLFTKFRESEMASTEGNANTNSSAHQRFSEMYATLPFEHYIFREDETESLQSFILCLTWNAQRIDKTTGNAPIESDLVYSSAVQKKKDVRKILTKVLEKPEKPVVDDDATDPSDTELIAQSLSGDSSNVSSDECDKLSSSSHSHSTHNSETDHSRTKRPPDDHHSKKPTKRMSLKHHEDHRDNQEDLLKDTTLKNHANARDAFSTGGHSIDPSDLIKHAKIKDVLRLYPDESPLRFRGTSSEVFSPEVIIQLGEEFMTQTFCFKFHQVLELAPPLTDRLNGLKWRVKLEADDKIVLKTYDESNAIRFCEASLDDVSVREVDEKYEAELEANCRISRYNYVILKKNKKNEKAATGNTDPADFDIIRCPRLYSAGSFRTSLPNTNPIRLGNFLLMKYIESDGRDEDGYSYIEQIARSNDNQELKEKLIEDGLRSLELIHTLGITHNDIKYRNMIVSEGKLFIIDFSEASIFDTVNPSARDIRNMNRDKILLRNLIRSYSDFDR